MQNAPNSIDNRQATDTTFLVFIIGKYQFCTDSSSIVTVIDPLPVTTIPRTPHTIAGVINFENKITPVWCLRTYFGSNGKNRPDEGKIIITRFLDGVAGFWVDDTGNYITVDESSCQNFKHFLYSAPVNEFVLHEEKMFLYVDFERLYKATMENSGSWNNIRRLPPQSSESTLSDSPLVSDIKNREITPVSDSLSSEQAIKQPDVADTNMADKKPTVSDKSIEPAKVNLQPQTGKSKNASDSLIFSDPQPVQDTQKPPNTQQSKDKVNNFTARQKQKLEPPKQESVPGAAGDFNSLDSPSNPDPGHFYTTVISQNSPVEQCGETYRQDISKIGLRDNVYCQTTTKISKVEKATINQRPNSNGFYIQIFGGLFLACLFTIFFLPQLTISFPDSRKDTTSKTNDVTGKAVIKPVAEFAIVKSSNENNLKNPVTIPVQSDLTAIYSSDNISTENSPVQKNSKGYIYTVKRGDTLWSIAANKLNDPAKYILLSKTSKLQNPDKIYPGDSVIIPRSD